MKRWLPATTLLLGGAFFQMEIKAQTVVTAINCTGQRLGGAEREICAAPELVRLNDDIDTLTKRLEMTLTGSDKAALVDTEGPFMVQRNNCQNERPAVRECVERILGGRMKALTAALNSPASIRSEITQYTFLNIPFFQRYGDLLIGRRIRVFGCMVLEPGPTPASRIYGTISEFCTKTKGPYVSVIFKSMDEKTATFFYDAKMPNSHWEGTVERREGRLVLSQIDP